MTNFRKYLLLSLFLALVNAAVLLIFFVPRFDHTDTSQYVSAINHVLGDENAELAPYRIMKPFPILIAALFNPILSPQNALIAQNILFYFLSSYLIFILIYRIYQNEKQAFYGTVLYFTAYPMIAYGLAALTDISGWFFYLLSVFFALDILKKPQIKKIFLAGFIAGFGMLFKENVAAAAIFFGALVLIATKFPLKEKLRYILVFGSAFLILPAINSIVIYNLFSFSYWSNYKSAWGAQSIGGFSSFYMITPLRILIEIARAFLLGWVFVLAGVLKEIFLKSIERIKILLSFILPSISFFVWSYPHNRMIYIAAPLLVLLGSFGLLRSSQKLKINNFIEVSSVFLFIIINYFILELLLKYGIIIQPSGTLFG